MTDPRAVSVSLVTPAAAAIDPIIVAPPGSPGGVAATAAVPEAELRVLDPERGVLLRPGEEPERVLMLPPIASDRPRVLRRELVVGGWRREVEVESAARAALRERARRGRAESGHSGPTEVHAIIPGVVVSVSVAAGDEVVAGQQLLAVEAMKMQNELRAPRDGVIERVAVGQGTTIEVGDLLLVIA